MVPGVDTHGEPQDAPKGAPGGADVAHELRRHHPDGGGEEQGRQGEEQASGFHRFKRGQHQGGHGLELKLFKKCLRRSAGGEAVRLPLCPAPTSAGAATAAPLGMTDLKPASGDDGFHSLEWW